MSEETYNEMVLYLVFISEYAFWLFLSCVWSSVSLRSGLRLTLISEQQQK